MKVHKSLGPGFLESVYQEALEKEFTKQELPFSKQFYLVGGTAIGLKIGHRQSIDFDLFSNELIRPNA